MTITVQPARNEYTANAGQTIFNYTFKIFADTDLNVYITPSGEVANDATQLTTNYTVTGIGDEDGGSITLTTGTNQDDLVTIVSNIPSSRTIDYQNNGDFRPVTVNADFDRVVSIAKKIEDIANRTVLLQQSQQDPKPLTLENPVAGMSVRWNGNGTGLENYNPSTVSNEEIGNDKVVINYKTLDIAINDNSLKVNQALNIKERTTGNRGGAMWDVVFASSVTTNTFNIVQCVGVPSLALVYRVPVDGVDLNALGVTRSPVDDGAAIQAGINLATEKNTVVIANDEKYRSTIPLTVTCQIKPISGEPEFEFVFGDTPVSICMEQTVEVDNIGFKVSALASTNVTAGYQVSLDSFEPKSKFTVDVAVEYIANADNTLPCYGVLVVAGSLNAYDGYIIDVGCRVKTITATANGVEGDAGGSSKGVIISINKAGMTNTIQSIDSYVESVYPIEDGDGIHFAVADHTDSTQLSSYKIINPVVRDCAKRAIKNQAPNMQIINPWIDTTLADGGMTLVALQSFGVNCTITSPTLRNESTTLSGDGFVSEGDNFVMTDMNIAVKRGRNFIRIASGSYDIRGGSIDVDEVYGTDEANMAVIDGDSSGILHLPKINRSVPDGSAVRYASNSTGKHTLRIGHVENCGRLVYSSFGTADITLEYINGTCANEAVFTAGTAQKITWQGSKVFAGTTAATFTCLFNMTGSHDINCTTNGITTAGAGFLNSSISGVIKLTATAGTGQGVAAAGISGGEIRGIASEGFATHLNLTSSSDTVIEGNIARGGGTPILGGAGAGNVEQNNMIVA